MVSHTPRYIPASVPRRKRAKSLLRRILANWEMYLLLLAPLAFFIIFCYGPMYGVLIAFKNYKVSAGILGSPWVGLAHFRKFFGSIFFERTMLNTVSINLYSLAAGFPIPIIVALMMNELRSKRFKKTVQTISYAPYFISQVVMVGIIIMFLSPFRDGVLNKLITAMGGDPIYFMIQPRYFKTIYVWSGIWQGTGWGTVIYMAALAGVDSEQLEAAVIDGANKLQRVWHISFPCIRPTIILLFILSAGNIMNIGFEKIFLMQNDLNMDASDVISTYVYRMGLLKTQYDFSAAVGLFNSVINLVILSSVNWIAKRVGETSLW